jgi:hypothetical protein
MEQTDEPNINHHNPCRQTHTTYPRTQHAYNMINHQLNDGVRVALLWEGTAIAALTTVGAVELEHAGDEDPDGVERGDQLPETPKEDGGQSGRPYGPVVDRLIPVCETEGLHGGIMG